MVPTSFEESNAVLDKPSDMTYDECEALSVWRGCTRHGVPVVVSCWKPTTDELEEINRTGRVWVTICGETMPPVALDGVNPWSSKEKQ